VSEPEKVKERKVSQTLPKKESARLTPKGKKESESFGEDSQGEPLKKIAPWQLWVIWEEFRGSLPEVRLFTKERIARCRNRIAGADFEVQFLDDFREAVRKAAAHPWPKWRPNFDWFIRNDTNYVSILEGKYDDWMTQEARNAQTIRRVLGRTGGDAESVPGKVPYGANGAADRGLPGQPERAAAGDAESGVQASDGAVEMEADAGGDTGGGEGRASGAHTRLRTG
jgi:hypothetical protein